MSVFRVALAGLINSVDQWRTVYTINSATTSVGVSDLTTWLDAQWTTSVLSQLSSKITIQRAIIETPNGDGTWSYSDEFVYTKAGTSGGDMLPNQMAVVVVGITASRRRGKKFIPGLVEASQNQGLLDSSGLTIWGTFAHNWTDTSIALPALPFESGVCDKNGANFLAFNSYRVDPILGTQRRRKQGVGI